MSVFFAKLASFAKPRDKLSKRELRMGCCFTSGNLKEREEVVVSSILIANKRGSRLDIVLIWPCYHDCVPEAKRSLLIAVFFFTSVISVVTGSTSLITVPVMIALGIEAHVAVANEHAGFDFNERGGSLPFVGRAFSAAAACRHRSLSRSLALAWAHSLARFFFVERQGGTSFTCKQRTAFLVCRSTWPRGDAGR
jgi:hypothetical protein